MTKINHKVLYSEAKQACFDLGLEPNMQSSRRILQSGKTSIKSMANYNNRKNETDIAKKFYTNENGEQEAFGDICKRNLIYAESFVKKNMAKFEGGVRNMTDASLHVMRQQRVQESRFDTSATEFLSNKEKKELYIKTANEVGVRSRGGDQRIQSLAPTAKEHAERFGVHLRTVENWEKERKERLARENDT
jgi:hypothetical protein